MKLSKCPNSHYYDGDTYSSCPFCGAAANEDRPTVAFSSDAADVTGAFSDSSAAVSAAASEPVTVKSSEVYTPSPAPKAEIDEPVTVKSQAVYEPTAPVQPALQPVAPMPSSDFAASPLQQIQPQVTMAAAPAGAMEPGVTMAAAPAPAPKPEPDAEKTVSYFETQFAGTDTAREFTEMKTEPVVGWLVCTAGNYFGASFQLKSGRNFISRSEGYDICLRGEQTVSRSIHAIIIYEPHERVFLIQPGDSRELFYVNDEVVLDSMPLKAYDDISLGKVSFRMVPFCTPEFAWEDLKSEENE